MIQKLILERTSNLSIIYTSDIVPDSGETHDSLVTFPHRLTSPDDIKNIKEHRGKRYACCNNYSLSSQRSRP